MHSVDSLAPLRAVIAQSLIRYATITPKGILLPHAAIPYNPLDVAIITYGPARTRYLNRRPLCRSLDGLRSIDNRTLCATCHDSRSCTPQIALDISYRRLPFRLLLAFTSAKNFLAALKTINPSAGNIQDAPISITVTNRGHWGEANFSRR
jgi:hypothetical protein